MATIKYNGVNSLTYFLSKIKSWASGKINGLIYDVSALHPTSGVSGGSTYASLSAALAVIPQDKRKGGMTVKFVLNSDNKYVQYRYMGTSTANAAFVNVANWQSVDDEPTAGSDNLVKSGGVEKLLYSYIFSGEGDTIIRKNLNLIPGRKYRFCFRNDVTFSNTGSLKKMNIRKIVGSEEINVVSIVANEALSSFYDVIAEEYNYYIMLRADVGQETFVSVVDITESDGLSKVINNHFYFIDTILIVEKDDSSNFYIRPENISANLRCLYNGLSYSWTDIAQQTNKSLTTSPKGLTDCILINYGEVLALNVATNAFEIVTQNAINAGTHILLFRSLVGRCIYESGLLNVVDFSEIITKKDAFKFTSNAFSIEIDKITKTIYFSLLLDKLLHYRDLYGSYNPNWNSFISSFNNGISPQGNKSLILSNGETFVYNVISNKFEIIGPIPIQYYYVLLLSNSGGKVSIMHQSVENASIIREDLETKIGIPLHYNLYRANSVMYTDGNYVGSSTIACATTSINVEGITKILLSKVVHDNPATLNGYAFYDENGDYLSGIKWKIGAEKRYELGTIDVPEGAVYFKGSFFNDFATYGTPFIGFPEKNAVLSRIQEIEQLSEEVNELYKECMIPKIINAVLDAKRPTAFNLNLSKKLLNILFITDTHQGGERQDDYTAINNMKAFVRLANEGFCDCAVHGGDIITDYGTSRNDAITWFDDSLKYFGDVNIPFLICRGNHDYNMKAREKADMSNLDWEHETYYYLQQTSPDGMMAYVAVTEETWDGVSQLYTGTDLANERIPNHQGFMLSQNNLSNFVRNQNDELGLYGYMDFEREKVRVIITNDYYVDASFNLMESISGQQLSWIENTALNLPSNDWKVVMFSHNNYTSQAALNSVISNFISGGGKFVAHIHGHQHIDTYTNSNGYNDIGVRSGFFDKSAEGTNQEYAFSVFTIDDDKIYETRFGVGSDRNWSY